jgi:hypothetical protein
MLSALTASAPGGGASLLCAKLERSGIEQISVMAMASVNLAARMLSI